MSPTALLLIFAVACSPLLLVSSGINVEREALIDAAIAEVNHEFSSLKKQKLTTSQGNARISSKKASKATQEGLAQGLASLKFERLVKVAEKKILRNQRLATVQTKSSMAEALASELLHKPGSILTSQEIARMYEESECEEVLETADCEDPLAQDFRTPDGSCNNLLNPTLGAASTPMRRLIPARYDDGVSRARGFLQSQDSELFRGPFHPPTPSPRVARTSIVEDRPLNDTLGHTHMLMQWGQFMDHDMSVISIFEDCPEGCEISEEDEGRCFPFAVPADDEAVLVTRTDSDSRGCHEFRRSLGACPPPGVDKLPLREQVNVLTHYIDGSMVYGHNEEIFADLIDFNSNGLLRTGPPAAEGSQRPLLPDAGPNSFVDCPEGSEPPPCFVAGDLRVNEQAVLSVMHTIWVREHNRIATIIGGLNSALSPEQVFLLARRIVASMIQKITYQDFIPLLIGDYTDMLIGPYEGYDDTVDPSIPNAFATAAYRYGHSQIQPFFDRLGADYESIQAGPLPLVDSFFDTSHVREFGTDPLVRGLLEKPARQVDEFLNSILTNQLFADDATSPGMDLAAINIQRGRDHGLPPYLVWKQWAEESCGKESDFRHELTKIHLYQAYGNLDSVDLFVGGLSEEPLPGGLVGAVFGCIFAHTFKNLRDGDRFYYENPDGPLNDMQREEINKATLSRVLCDNTDITEIQPNAFFAQPRVPCDDLPEVDISVFVDIDGTPMTPTTDTPIECFMRVTGSGVSINVISTNGDEPVLLVSNEPSSCYEVRCPLDSGSTMISATSVCLPDVNDGLPDSSQTSFYQGSFNAADFNGQAGLYDSFESCQVGSETALVFNCDSTSQNTVGDFARIETGSIDLVREMAGDAVARAMFDHSAAAVSNEDKLVSLMEEMLEELKTSSHKESVKQQDSDRSLVSELEKVLEELE